MRLRTVFLPRTPATRFAAFLTEGRPATFFTADLTSLFPAGCRLDTFFTACFAARCTVATAPLTIFHFQQLAVYGVIGNAVVVPLSAIIIMPAAVVSLLVMPWGYEAIPLHVMGAGITGMLDVSTWVAALPQALQRRRTD